MNHVEAMNHVLTALLDSQKPTAEPKTIRPAAFDLDGEHFPSCDELDNVGLGWKFDTEPTEDQGCRVRIVQVFFYSGTKQVANLPPSILTDAFVEGMEAEIAESEDVKAMYVRMEANERRREDDHGRGDWEYEQRKDREAMK